MKNNLIVYENGWIIQRIYEVSDRIRDKLTDQTLFEERCIKRITDYLLICETNKRNKRYIERLINEVASAVIERNRNEYAELFSELSTESEEDKEMEYEPIDVLADVESEVIKRETVTLLAENDCRRLTVLEGWAIGNTNDNQISRALARTYGGNPESHRKFIQRFRLRCREQMSAAI